MKVFLRLFGFALKTAHIKVATSAAAAPSAVDTIINCCKVFGVGLFACVYVQQVL